MARREPYRLIAKGRPDADGYQRFTYPPRGTYLAEDPVTGKPVKPVTRTSITIPMLIPDTPSEDEKDKNEGTKVKNEGKKDKKKKNQPIKHLQKFPRLSRDWKDHYGMRSLVESSNKLLKDPSAEDLGNTAKRSGRGYAFQYLVSTLASASSNLRRIFTFLVEEAKRSSGGKLERVRRRKDEQGKTLAHSSAPAALAPPQ